jgi:kumamolisin
MPLFSPFAERTKPRLLPPQTPPSQFEQITRVYNFPSTLSGGGQCIGLLSFGGALAPSDVARYFISQNAPTPDVHFRAVRSALNLNRNSFHDRELALDIQIAAGLAPGARIVAYLSSNDYQGWHDALATAIRDRDNRPSVLSLSWGDFEDHWNPIAMDGLNELLAEAAAAGITVCAASGDDGCARDAEGRFRVTFPASSPFVLACGGTQLDLDGYEAVWNVRNKSASGGGITAKIPRPNWQPRFPAQHASNSDFDGRQLPDVAALASHSYTVFAGNRYHHALGGTSAAAPLWAALIARVNEGLQQHGLPPVGFLNQRLYNDPHLQQAFRPITQGQNDPFTKNGHQARPGWNPCTGWGTPNAQKLLDALAAKPVPTAHRNDCAFPELDKSGNNLQLTGNR